MFRRPKLSPCFCLVLFWLNWFAFQLLAALFCHILQCFAQSTWRHCGFLRQHNMQAFANVPGLCVPVFFLFIFCYYSFIYFLAMCSSICSLMTLCKFKEWATWAGNSIPMMHHEARYSSSSTKLALWNKGSALTVTC